MCSQFTIFVYFFSGASCLFRGAPDSRFFILSCCMHVLLSNFLILSQPASCCDLYTYIVNWGLGGANVTECKGFPAARGGRWQHRSRVYLQEGLDNFGMDPTASQSAAFEVSERWLFDFDPP